MPHNGKRPMVQQSGKSAPRLSTCLHCHRNNLRIVSCSSVAIHFGFDNLLDGNWDIRQKIISCSFLDRVDAGHVGLPLRADTVDVWRVDGDDAGLRGDAAEILGSIGQDDGALERN